MHILRFSRFKKGENFRKKKSQRYPWGSVRYGGSKFEMSPKQFTKWFSKVTVLPNGWTELLGGRAAE